MQEAAELVRSSRLWLTIAAASMLLLVTSFSALISVVLCHAASRAAQDGQFADARAKLRWGKIVAVVGIATAIALIAAVVVTR